MEEGTPLKDCPFCGISPTVKEYYVECGDCLIKTTKYSCSLFAIMAWNKRVTHDI